MLVYDLTMKNYKREKKKISFRLDVDRTNTNSNVTKAISLALQFDASNIGSIPLQEKVTNFKRYIKNRILRSFDILDEGDPVRPKVVQVLQSIETDLNT